MQTGFAPGAVAAARDLGLRLLVGRNAPFDPKEGIALLTSCAERGDAEALAQMPTLKGAGAWMPSNWNEALDLLAQAAERGSARARGQLKILASDRGLAERAARENAHWRAVRATVDIAAWRTPPARRAICEASRIRVVGNFVPREACDWLIARGARHRRRKRRPRRRRRARIRGTRSSVERKR